MKNRWIAFISILLTVLLCCASCGKSGTEGRTPGSSDQGAEATVTAPTGTETATEKKYADNLPDNLNFGGKTVTFLYREEIAEEFYTDTSNGEIVNDALHESIMSVEERLNVDIQCVKKEGHLLDQRTVYMNAVTNTVRAGDYAWDWVDLMIGNSPSLAAEGIFYDLLDINFLDLKQPWYIRDMEETLTIHDRLYFISGDASLGYLKCAYCIFWNKDMASSLHLDDLSAIAESGQWTMDKLIEYAAAAGSDLNGDGTYDQKDVLGYVNHDSNHPKGFMGALATPLFTKDETGEWKFTYGNERDYLAAQKITELKTRTPGVYFYSGNNATEASAVGYNELSQLFCADRILMISSEMDDIVSQYRNMTSDVGILPLPKLNEEQESYYTLSRSTHNAFSMPITCKETDCACAVYEALGASNYKTVFPVYYELALKTKYSPDADTARMYDIIHDTMILDFGYVFTMALSANPVTLYVSSTGNAQAFASSIKASSKLISTSLATYLEKAEKNCG